jgi:hypothetical protein
MASWKHFIYKAKMERKLEMTRFYKLTLFNVEVQSCGATKKRQSAVGAAHDRSTVTFPGYSRVAKEFAGNVVGFRIQADLVVESRPAAVFLTVNGGQETAR